MASIVAAVLAVVFHAQVGSSVETAVVAVAGAVTAVDTVIEQLHHSAVSKALAGAAASITKRPPAA